MKNTLQIELAKMEREILALKTASKVSPKIQAYTKTSAITPSTTSETTTVTITYGDGTQPIISELYYDYGDAIGFTPSGNAQKVVLFSQVAGNFTVVSTRPILSIVGF